MKKPLIKLYNLLPLHTKNGIETLVNKIVPLYLQFRYNLKLALYALPLLVLWIIPVTFEKDIKSLNVAKRSMVMFFLYLFGILLIYVIGILMLAMMPNNYHVYVAPLQYILQTIITVIYTGTSLFYAYRVFKNDTEIESFYLSFEKKLEAALSK